MINHFYIRVLFIFLISTSFFSVLITYSYLLTSNCLNNIVFGPTNSLTKDKEPIEKNLDFIINTINQNPDYQVLDFENFDNNKGANKHIVPNIVHLLYLQTTSISFYQAINIYSIFLNQNPDVIYIHCDNCSFSGHYWDQINSVKKLKDIIKINKIPLHDTIFGIEYGWIEHRSDVLRLLILMLYGGIYLDNDVYVVKSLDKFRKFEMTIGWEEVNVSTGSQILIANRNARLLKAHYDMYRTNYTPSEWYYNAGHVPGKILVKNREIAHLVKVKFGTFVLTDELYLMYWKKWRKFYTIHLLINHRYYLDKDSPIKEFDSKNILTYNKTYGVMCRTVMRKMKTKYGIKFN